MSDRADLLKELSIPNQARENRSGAGRWIAVAVALVAIIGALYGLLNFQRELPKVTTATAAAITKGNSGGAVLDGSGYVVARRQATVSAKTTGKVLEVMLQEGMQVTEGQILARLDPINAQAQLDLAQSQVRAARSRVQETEVALKQAERELSRQQDLAARKLTSQQALDQALSSADSLKARLSSARDEIRVSEASLKINQQQLDDTVVRAPFAGMVIAKAAQPGEMISPLSAGGGFTRTGIGTIVDMNSLEVEIDVNESFIARVTPQQQAQITLNAYPDDVFPGHVIAIIPAADRTKATVKVRVGFDQLDGRILPDMGARVQFLGANASAEAPPPKGVLIPSSAIIDGKVWAIVDGKVALKDVQIAEVIGSNARIESGLQVGAVVITEGQSELKEGQQVQAN